MKVTKNVEFSKTEKKLKYLKKKKIIKASL